MNSRKCAILTAGIVSCLGIFADAGFAGIAKLSGGSGYSGALSKNPTIRRQQLICDPAGDTVSGSTSTTYNPNLVSLVGMSFGPGYTGLGVVEESVASPSGSYNVLQSISSFLSSPVGTQTGYVQVVFTMNGTPGTISPPSGFSPIMSAGVNGVDTHELTFQYLSSTPSTTNSTYKIYADTGLRPSHNMADSLTGMGPGGTLFTIPASQLSSATVSGNVAAVPLPPAAWTGSAMMLALMGVTVVRKRAKSIQQSE